jgi:hypothetical protein
VATLLVSDTSVLVDLDRGGILDVIFQLPYDVGVPDVLYDLELKDWEGPKLLALGLKILALDGDGVALAQRYRGHDPRLSLPDAFALALAKTENHILLAGDASLRALAEIEEVEVHGLLWVMDAIEARKTLSLAELLQALALIAQHRRCRLPKGEIQQRLKRYDSQS